MSFQITYRMGQEAHIFNQSWLHCCLVNHHLKISQSVPGHNKKVIAAQGSDSTLITNCISIRPVVSGIQGDSRRG
jgi:hypothetical protein